MIRQPSRNIISWMFQAPTQGRPRPALPIRKYLQEGCVCRQRRVDGCLLADAVRAQGLSSVAVARRRRRDIDFMLIEREPPGWTGSAGHGRLVPRILVGAYG